MTVLSCDTVLIGESQAMRRLRALIATVAPTRLSVLIEGATGTGKELIAGTLHQQSGRTGNLVAFNVCALGESMFEDALFGHVRGAYTGAIGESMGFLREANGGTVFLDEISGLPLMLQAKLLRAVETGIFRPIGAARDARSDFRIIAATNERISTLVDVGRFRADLRHRLSGIVISVPALAERIDDIPSLTRHFVSRGCGPELPVDSAAVSLLMETPWPGNIRELKQVVDAAAAFAHGRIDRTAIEMAMAHRSTTEDLQIASTELAHRRDLVATLELEAWDIDLAAIRLGVHRATLYRRIKRYGIDVPRAAGRVVRA